MSRLQRERKKERERERKRERERRREREGALIVSPPLAGKNFYGEQVINNCETIYIAS